MSDWREMETAPKDGTEVLVWHDHDSDKYFLPNGNLTEYGAWAEGNGHAGDPGRYIARWGGGFYDGAEDGGGQMPDWWFVDRDFEIPAAPTYWSPLPEPPKSKE